MKEEVAVTDPPEATTHNIRPNDKEDQEEEWKEEVSLSIIHYRKPCPPGEVYLAARRKCVAIYSETDKSFVVPS